MYTLRSWRALLVREYLEHRIAFLYFPAGIVALLALSALSALGFNRVKLAIGIMMPSSLKLFEFGYLALVVLWLAYLAVSLFFYFGDAFSADRRNNAMFFWKSMPVSDLKILASKFLAGTALFPAIILIVAMVTGLLHYGVVNVATLVFRGLIVPAPLDALTSFVNITGFALASLVLGLLWYAPFLAWVGGLSTVFGRWSLPLAFVIPGMAAVVENVAFFGNGPRGGYIWAYLSQRLHFGIPDSDLLGIVMSPAPFNGPLYASHLLGTIDWVSMGTGLVFAAVAIWLASEYRRRRIA